MGKAKKTGAQLRQLQQQGASQAGGEIVSGPEEHQRFEEEPRGGPRTPSSVCSAEQPGALSPCLPPLAGGAGQGAAQQQEGADRSVAGRLSAFFAGGGREEAGGSSGSGAEEAASGVFEGPFTTLVDEGSESESLAGEAALGGGQHDGCSITGSSRTSRSDAGEAEFGFCDDGGSGSTRARSAAQPAQPLSPQKHEGSGAARSSERRRRERGSGALAGIMKRATAAHPAAPAPRDHSGRPQQLRRPAAQQSAVQRAPRARSADMGVHARGGGARRPREGRRVVASDASYRHHVVSSQLPQQYYENNHAVTFHQPANDASPAMLYSGRTQREAASSQPAMDQAQAMMVLDLAAQVKVLERELRGARGGAPSHGQHGRAVAQSDGPAGLFGAGPWRQSDERAAAGEKSERAEAARQSEKTEKSEKPEPSGGSSNGVSAQQLLQLLQFSILGGKKGESAEKPAASASGAAAGATRKSRRAAAEAAEGASETEEGESSEDEGRGRAQRPAETSFVSARGSSRRRARRDGGDTRSRRPADDRRRSSASSASAASPAVGNGADRRWRNEDAGREAAYPPARAFRNETHGRGHRQVFDDLSPASCTTFASTDGEAEFRARRAPADSSLGLSPRCFSFPSALAPLLAGAGRRPAAARPVVGTCKNADNAAQQPGAARPRAAASSCTPRTGGRDDAGSTIVVNSAEDACYKQRLARTVTKVVVSAQPPAVLHGVAPFFLKFCCFVVGVFCASGLCQWHVGELEQALNVAKFELRHAQNESDLARQRFAAAQREMGAMRGEVMSEAVDFFKVEKQKADFDLQSSLNKFADFAAVEKATGEIFDELDERAKAIQTLEAQLKADVGLLRKENRHMVEEVGELSKDVGKMETEVGAVRKHASGVKAELSAFTEVTYAAEVKKVWKGLEERAFLEELEEVGKEATALGAKTTANAARIAEVAGQVTGLEAREAARLAAEKEEKEAEEARIAAAAAAAVASDRALDAMDDEEGNDEEGAARGEEPTPQEGGLVRKKPLALGAQRPQHGGDAEAAGEKEQEKDESPSPDAPSERQQQRAAAPVAPAQRPAQRPAAGRPLKGGMLGAAKARGGMLGAKLAKTAALLDKGAPATPAKPALDEGSAKQAAAAEAEAARAQAAEEKKKAAAKPAKIEQTISVAPLPLYTGARGQQGEKFRVLNEHYKPLASGMMSAFWTPAQVDAAISAEVLDALDVEGEPADGGDDDPRLIKKHPDTLLAVEPAVLKNGRKQPDALHNAMIGLDKLKYQLLRDAKLLGSPKHSQGLQQRKAAFLREMREQVFSALPHKILPRDVVSFRQAKLLGGREQRATRFWRKLETSDRGVTAAAGAVNPFRMHQLAAEFKRAATELEAMTSGDFNERCREPAALNVFLAERGLKRGYCGELLRAMKMFLEERFVAM